MLRADARTKQAEAFPVRAMDQGSQPDASPGTLRAITRKSTVYAPMKQHLAVSAIGSDRTGMVHELTRVISECGGNIAESRMAALGSGFAMLLLVSGNWH